MNYSKEELKEFMFKEIKIIQDIIKRMAFNSFLIKGWTITLVAATLLLNGSKYQIFISYIPLFAFWFLDAYFLRKEKLYRKLYEWVIQHRLETDEFLLDMKIDRFEKEVKSSLKLMFSITLGWFYFSIFILTFIYTIILLMQKGGC
jgi:hypothetical protein